MSNFGRFSLFTVSLLVGGILAVACNTMLAAPAETTTPTVKEVISPVPSSPASLNVTAKKKRVFNVTLPADRTVSLVGEVNELNANVVSSQILQLGKTKEPIFLVINSPGGSVLDGALIISAIEAAQGPVYTVCASLCASMAAMIFEYGSERLVVDRSYLMFHPAFGGLQGEVDKMKSRIDSIQRFIGKMEAYVATRSNITHDRYKQLSSVELWVDGEDAVNSGFADRLVSVTMPDLYGADLGSNNLTWKRNLPIGIVTPSTQWIWKAL